MNVLELSRARIFLDRSNLEGDPPGSSLYHFIMEMKNLDGVCERAKRTF